MASARSRILIRAGLGVVAAALLCASLAWRLGRGPIPLPFLDRPIAQALAGLTPDLVVRIERTELAWSERAPEVRVLGVRLDRSDGTRVLSLPALSVRLSLRALLRGRIAMRRIDLSGGRLALVRTTEGRVTLGTSGASDDATAEGPAGLLAALADQKGTTAEYLSRIGIHDADLVLDDRLTASVWQVADVDLVVSRHADLLVASLGAKLALRSGTVAALRELSLPFSATAKLSLAADGRIGSLAFALEGKNGRIALVGDTGSPLPLHSLQAEGTYTGDSGTLELSSLQAGVGSARLDSTATAVLRGAGTTIEARGDLRALPVAELQRLWPRGLEAATRHWISRNVRDGVITGCRFALRLPSGSASDRPPAPSSIDVAFDFADLTVRYLPALDPLRAVRGSARLAADRFEARVEAAEVGNLRVRGGQMAVDLAGKPARATITMDVQGPSAELLALLDRPPLSIPHQLGISWSDIGGGSDVHAEIRLPLAQALTAAQVGLSATAELRDARLPDIVYGIGIEKGRLTVRVDGRRVDIEGETRLVGLPAVTEPVRVALGFDPGARGDGGRLRAVVDGPELSVEGTATLAGGMLYALTLRRLRFGRNDLSAEVTRRSSGEYRVSLDGASFDLEPLLAHSPSAGQGVAVRVPYALEFRLKRVIAATGLDLAEVHGNVHGDGGRIRSLAAAGGLAGGGMLRVSLTAADGRRRLALTSDQGGKVLKALGVFDNAVGGKLSVTATLDDGEPGTRLEGLLEMHDFRVVRTPILARVLSLGSLGGMADLLSGDGIPFTHAHFPFRWSDGRLELHDARAVGAIGLTADGVIDRGGGRIDLSGDIVPAHTLNAALGNLPLIGKLFVGTKGGGVFGIEYRVSGGLDKPDVRTNSLSVLAPGILRKMFVNPFATGR